MELNAEALDYFIQEEPYEGSHDFFYKSEDYAGIKELESNWQVIKKELVDFLTNQQDINVKNLNPPYLSSPDAWKILYFYNFGWKNYENCIRFPKTHALLKSIPNMSFGGFTVLKPKSKVLPHYGETNAIIRCHLGLTIPAPYPICGMRVGTEERGWEEGKVLMFSDAHLHTAWNDSDELRYVLVFDIIRNEYASQKHSICANVLGALSLKYFYSKKPSLKELPRPLVQAVHFLFSSFWHLYLPIQNRFRLP